MVDIQTLGDHKDRGLVSVFVVILDMVKVVHLDMELELVLGSQDLYILLLVGKVMLGWECKEILAPERDMELLCVQVGRLLLGLVMGREWADEVVLPEFPVQGAEVHDDQVQEPLGWIYQTPVTRKDDHQYPD